MIQNLLAIFGSKLIWVVSTFSPSVMNESQRTNSSIPQTAKQGHGDRVAPTSQSLNFEEVWQHLRPLALALGFIFFSFFPIWQLWDNSFAPSALASPAPSAKVGTTPGEFAVNGNGGATYAIPIEVPPGINGVQPNLSLVYNSQQGNGLLGVGWELAGLSAIARCGKNLATDGEIGGINFDEDDRFCFDGQRLMAIRGSYGADGTEYRTERETWVRAISHTEGGKNGPRSFTLTTQDGHQMEFGTSEDAKILAEGRSDGAVQVWALNKISDRNGNFVEISYQQDSSRLDPTIRGAFLGYFPTEIRYTGNSDAKISPLRVVEFKYENRNDKIVAYIGGSKAETTQRLARIKTYVDLDGNNIATAANLVKEYRLSYEYAPVTGRSIITQLEECDAAGVCLPATNFAYQQGERKFSPQRLWIDRFGYGQGWRIDKNPRMTADVNGDGLADVVGFGNDGVEVSVSNGEDFERDSIWVEDFSYNKNWRTEKHPRMMADVNGDGLSDVVGFGNNGVEISTSKGTSFNQRNRWIDWFGYNANEWRIEKHPRMMADVNGDGLADVVGFGDPGVWISFSTGRDFTPRDLLVGDFGYNQSWRVDRHPRMMADVNGDGLADVVGFGSNGVRVSLSTGRSFKYASLWLNEFGYNQSWRVDRHPRMMADVNGDGLADVVGFGDEGVWVSLSTGTSFKSRELWVSDFGYNQNWRVEKHPRMMVDVNGDGLTDVVGFGYNGVEVSLSTGTSFEKRSRWISEYGGWNQDRYLQEMADVNGDGIADVVGFGDRGVLVSVSEAKSELLTEIVDGLQGKISIEYKPLTDKTVYTKGSGATYPEVDAQPPIYVVSRYEMAESADNPSNTFVYENQYEGAKTDFERGWLGFEKTILIDRQNETKTITTYHTDFPLLGMVAAREIRDSSDRLLEKISSSYESSKSGSLYKFWETGVAMDYYTDGKHSYTLERTYEYDKNHQNAIVIADLGDVEDPDDDVYTCLAYYFGGGNSWWKSFFPLEQKVVKSAEGCGNFGSWNEATDLRWEQFYYDTRMNLTSHDRWQDRNGFYGSTGSWLTSDTAYDECGNVITQTDSADRTSEIVYEDKYHTFPELTIAPPAQSGETRLEVRTEYEPKFGIKTKVIDVNGNTSMLIADSDIDGFGRILAIQGIKPDSQDLVTLQKNEFIAENSGMSLKTWYRTQWDGNNTPDETWLWGREYIDGLGRTYKTELEGDGGQTILTTAEFNAIGQTSKESLSHYAGESQHFLRYEYDIRGELVKTTDPIGAVTQIDRDRQYDKREITYSVADPRDDSSGSNFVESLLKNTSRGWMQAEQQADGGNSSYTYDRLGQVISMTDPLGQKTEIVYNSLGQVLSETTPETGTTQYIYNENGEVIRQIDANNQEIRFRFDALGRPIAKDIYGSTSSIPVRIEDYEYDTVGVKNGKGALTKILVRELDRDETIILTTNFSYNNRGEIETEKVEVVDGNSNMGNYTTRYTYDAVGRPDTMTYPDGSVVRYTYNDAGELYTVELRDTGESNFSTYATYENYTALGEIGKVTYNRNQVESNYTYDAVGRITDSTTKKGAHTYFDFDYTWNKANKILAIRDNAGQGLNQNFGYDTMGRLIQAKGEPYEDLSYQYDRAGNITKRNDTTYAYKSDKKHQLAAATYDANGNTVAYESWTYTYDPENHLRRVEKDSNLVNKFAYDDSGSRLKKVEADGTTTYYVAPFYEVVTQPDNSQIHTKYIVGSQGAVAAISKNGSNVNLVAAIKGNSAALEASFYDPHSWGGLAKFLGAKFTQLSLNGNLAEALIIFAFVSWLAVALGLWFYRLWREASPESGLGRSRAIAARSLASIGSLSPFSAEKLTASENKGWLLKVWYRPVSFSLALISFASMSLSSAGMLAQLTPGANGPGYPVAGQVLYFHYDQLGSTTLVTDAQANAVSQVNYEPYGAIAKSSSGEDAFRPKFTGKEYDSNSELYYFGSRYYDGHLGRFLTPDPARQYFSPYVYGNGDPLTGIDPDGEGFFAILGIIIGVAAGALMGGAIVNDSFNPASWDWSSGKTWAGLVGGGLLGGAAAGIGVAAGGAIAASALGTFGQTVAQMAVAGGIMGVMNASFTAMAGGNISDVAAAFGLGFAQGAFFAIPGVGAVGLAGSLTYNTYQVISDPSIESGIQLGMDILALGMLAGMRLSQGGKRSASRGGCSSCACSSFVAGTEVATAEGEKAIEEIAVGDLVLAYNEDTGEEGEYPVSQLLRRTALESVILTVGDETVTTTPEHEFYTANGWVEAEHLHEGDTLVRLGGKTAMVTDVEKHQDSTRVYNFEVDEAHTYYVSRQELLVHNPKGCGWVSEGGKHGRTKQFSEKLIVESNHFPAADSYKGTPYKVSRDRMPAVTMDYDDHRIARSTGSSNAAKKWRQKQNQFMKNGQYDKAMGMDIRDMKNITLSSTGNSTHLKNGMTDAIKYAQSLGFLDNAQTARLIKLAGTPNTTPYKKFY
ncbi:MAG: VCBS repeat-containing protein [Cyanobacteria bacterium SBLK]|nr:VCBS repeat-containing protein [Cyanobacteria bacterium SBLK]